MAERSVGGRQFFNIKFAAPRGLLFPSVVSKKVLHADCLPKRTEGYHIDVAAGQKNGRSDRERNYKTNIE